MRELHVQAYLYNRKVILHVLHIIFEQGRHQNEHMLEAWLKTIDKLKGEKENFFAAIISEQRN